MSEVVSKTRILVLAYSHSGGVRQGVNALCTPLELDADIVLDYHWIEPGSDYPFPWKKRRFFEVFPECILGEALENKTGAQPLAATYDLIILGWQPWYLAPSLPIQAFFQSENARVFDQTPVVSLIACRNMWYSSYHQICALIQQSGGTVVDNVVYTHQGHPLATFFTTVRLLWTGKKQSIMGLPAGGFADTEVEELQRFGEEITRHKQRLSAGMEPMFSKLKPVRIKEGPMVAEILGRRYYEFIAPIIRKAGPQGGKLRKVCDLLFGLHLIPAIMTILILSAGFRLWLRAAGNVVLNRHTARFLSPYRRPDIAI